MPRESSTIKWMKNIKSQHRRDKRYIDYKIHSTILSEIEKEERIKNKQVSEDTILRKEIHERIKKQVEDGGTILEIVQDLNSKKEYQKYAMYFPTWINDAFKKYKKSLNRIKKEDMER